MVSNLFILVLVAVLTFASKNVSAELNIENALAHASAVQEQLELRQQTHTLRALNKEECIASDFTCLLASPEILVESLTPFLELLMSNTTDMEELEGICDDWTNCDFKGSIIEANMTAECYIKGGQNVTTDIRLCDRLKDDIINWMKESELVNGFLSEEQVNELIQGVQSVNVTEVQWTNVPLCMHRSCKPDFGLDALGPCLQTLVDQLSQDEDPLGLPQEEFTFITDLVTSIFSKEECSSSSMLMTGVAGLVTLGVALLTF